MALTALQVKAAKATDKPVKLSDGGGMFLLVQPDGKKYWRLAYRFLGKQKTLALGVYPDVSLLDARKRRDDARKLLADGIDPGANRKATKAAKQGSAANSFEVIAGEWLAKFSAKKAASTIEKTHFILRRDVFSLGWGRCPLPKSNRLICWQSCNASKAVAHWKPHTGQSSLSGK